MKYFFILILILRFEKLFENSKHGLIEIDNKGNDMFYILFESQNNPSKDPLLVYFDGGPGCSSLFVCLKGICPKILENDKYIDNLYNWNKNANLLIIDQPIGTGFSKGNKEDMPEYTIQAANHILIFFKKFYNIYPEFKNRDFYWSGVSYAGHFIPIFSAAILNSDLDYINLKGILVGNGFYDYNTQFNGYTQFSLKYDLMSKNNIFIMKIYFKIIKFFNTIFMFKYSFDLLINKVVYPLNFFKKKFNIYDISKENDYYDKDLYKFLQSKKVLKELNLTDRKWIKMNFDVRDKLKKDLFISTIPFINHLLKNNINVFLLNGKNDYVCNYFSNRDVNKKIKKFINKNNIDINLFKYFEIENAGHIVPIDKSDKVGEILNYFINSK